MLIYSPVITPRLQYVAAFCGNELTGKAFDVTNDRTSFADHAGPKLNYSSESFPGCITITPTALLMQTGISGIDVPVQKSGDSWMLFPGGGDTGFDLFSAVFYLLSRYEEYLPHEKDSYGRYPHTASIAFRSGFLEEPVINTWLDFLAGIIQKKFPAFTRKSRTFIFQPSYDIDIAWSYKHKGWLRNTGGWVKSMLKGQWRAAGERIAVLRGNKRDPFDSYGWMNSLHERLKLRPYYFFLLAGQTMRYDKNISPGHPAMQALIKDHIIRYPVGIHPSWQSGDDDGTLAKEIQALASITGTTIQASRQHYIRFNLPQGYRRLIEQGIRFDFSMGYGSINGFRASVASPFYWYDLQHEKVTDLLLFPFCYMEANSFYEQHFPAAKALEEMRHYYRVIKNVEGFYCMIWHNSFLGDDPQTKEWRAIYEQFLTEISPASA